MLPGLVLTVSLIAQSGAQSGAQTGAPSLGSLISAPNPDAPRFVNIGDDIIQSRTAKPVPPDDVCAPVPPVPVSEREIVLVPVRSNDASDAADASIEATA